MLLWPPRTTVVIVIRYDFLMTMRTLPQDSLASLDYPNQSKPRANLEKTRTSLNSDKLAFNRLRRLPAGTSCRVLGHRKSDMCTGGTYEMQRADYTEQISCDRIGYRE